MYKPSMERLQTNMKCWTVFEMIACLVSDVLKNITSVADWQQEHFCRGLVCDNKAGVLS